MCVCHEMNYFGDSEKKHVLKDRVRSRLPEMVERITEALEIKMFEEISERVLAQFDMYLHNWKNKRSIYGLRYFQTSTSSLHPKKTNTYPDTSAKNHIWSVFSPFSNNPLPFSNLIIFLVQPKAPRDITSRAHPIKNSRSLIRFPSGSRPTFSISRRSRSSTE